MSADERCYLTFEGVNRTFHQIVNRLYDIRHYDFDRLFCMEFKGGSGKCTVMNKGWMSVFCCTSDNETIGSLTMDICSEENICRTFDMRGHVMCNKNFTSVDEKTENGTENILTISAEAGKLTAIYYSISKLNGNQQSDNEMRVIHADVQKNVERKRHTEEKKASTSVQVKDKSLKLKEKRRLEDSRRNEDHDLGKYPFDMFFFSI